MAQVVVKEEVPVSAYIYSGKLDWETTYFWQVKAVEPGPSEPSPVSTFTVVSEPTTLATTVVTPPTPFWIWLIIGILALLDIVIIVFCLVSR